MQTAECVYRTCEAYVQTAECVYELHRLCSTSIQTLHRV